MTKLQQITKVKVHSVTGKTEEELVKVGGDGLLSSLHQGRASGRTTAILLKAIAEAQLVASGTVGFCEVEDHYHLFSHTKMNADGMRIYALQLIETLGLRGFDVQVVSLNNGRGSGKRFGVRIIFSTWTEAIYELRK